MTQVCVCDESALGVTMDTLKRTLESMIREKDPFPLDVFHLVYCYQRESKEIGIPIWKVCESQLRDVLKIERLEDTPVHWQWLQTHFLKNPVLLDSNGDSR